ncbi:MAG: DUF5362 domain-containing protein [Acidimicrobiia bacterium]
MTHPIEIDPVKTITRPLFEAKGWMKFLAVALIAVGALTALSIVGIIVAWIPIWAGALLWQAASRIEPAHLLGDQEAATESLSKLKTLFVLYGILTLIYIALVAVAILTVVNADITFG